MTLSEFNKAVKNNAEIMQKNLENRTVDFNGLVFWEGSIKNFSIDQVMSSWADIMACSVIGAIPSITNNGADGYMYTNGKIRPVEVEGKLSSTHHKSLAVSKKKGTLYWSSNLSNSKSKTSILSRFAGLFNVNMTDGTLQTKNRDTYLVLFDRDENKFITVFKLSGKKVLNLLEDRLSNSESMHSVSIKLNVFKEHGEEVEGMWQLEGWDLWYERMVKITTEAGRFIISNK